jgi:hypothetical protein
MCAAFIGHVGAARIQHLGKKNVVEVSDMQVKRIVLLVVLALASVVSAGGGNPGNGASTDGHLPPPRVARP